MKNLTTTLPLVNGGVDYAILTGKGDSPVYKDGVRTDDIEIKLDIALQHQRLETLSVKFPEDPLPNVSDEQIEKACREMKFVYVQIPNCKIKLYSRRDDTSVSGSATATSAKLLNVKSETS